MYIERQQRYEGRNGRLYTSSIFPVFLRIRTWASSAYLTARLHRPSGVETERMSDRMEIDRQDEHGPYRTMPYRTGTGTGTAPERLPERPQKSA